MRATTHARSVRAAEARNLVISHCGLAKAIEAMHSEQACFPPNVDVSVAAVQVVVGRRKRGKHLVPNTRGRFLHMLKFMHACQGKLQAKAVALQRVLFDMNKRVCIACQVGWDIRFEIWNMCFEIWSRNVGIWDICFEI